MFSAAGLRRVLEQSGLSIVATDRCFERSAPRKILHYVRNLLASAAGFAFWRSLLGRAAFGSLRLDAKLPYGNLVSVVARRGA